MKATARRVGPRPHQPGTSRAVSQQFSEAAGRSISPDAGRLTEPTSTQGNMHGDLSCQGNQDQRRPRRPHPVRLPTPPCSPWECRLTLPFWTPRRREFASSTTSSRACAHRHEKPCVKMLGRPPVRARRRCRVRRPRVSPRWRSVRSSRVSRQSAPCQTASVAGQAVDPSTRRRQLRRRRIAKGDAWWAGTHGKCTLSNCGTYRADGIQPVGSTLSGMWSCLQHRR